MRDHYYIYYQYLSLNPIYITSTSSGLQFMCCKISSSNKNHIINGQTGRELEYSCVINHNIHQTYFLFNTHRQEMYTPQFNYIYDNFYNM